MTNFELMQTTLVILKPDAVRRALVGEILARLERMGLALRGLKLHWADEELAGRHYTWEDIGARHGEAVRNNLIRFLTGGPVVVAAVFGDHAVEVVRKLCGPTEPLLAPPGTIRGDYCHHGFVLSSAAGQAIRNVIHASANTEDAARELALWFRQEELFPTQRNDQEEHLFKTPGAW